MKHISNAEETNMPMVETIALPELVNVPTEGKKILQDSHPLYQVRATVDVVVGHAEISVEELLSAQENHILVLDRTIEDEIDLMIEGRLVARGKLVAVDDRFAIQITELPEALDLGGK